MSSEFFGLEKTDIHGHLANHYQENGWVYILSNASLPGMVKIGMMNRHGFNRHLRVI